MVGLISILTGALLAIAFVPTLFEDDDKVYYNQKWYKDAAEEFGEDYYYPPATHRSIMNSAGTVIRNSQHYLPVRSSTYSATETNLTPWFVETKAVHNGGYEKFLERTFNSVRNDK